MKVVREFGKGLIMYVLLVGKWGGLFMFDELKLNMFEFDEDFIFVFWRNF